MPFIDRFLQMFDYLSVLLRAATLTFQTATIGGVGFLALVLTQAGPEAGEIENTCRQWIRRAALALAATQALYVATNLTILTLSAGLSFEEAIGANLVYAAGLSIAGALAIAYWSAGRRMQRGALLLLPAALILVSSAMTSHAAARMDHRLPLAVLTWLHQAATAVWIGGLPFLLFVLYTATTAKFLQETARRFSRLAFVSVCVLAGAGTALGVVYVGTWSGFYGTAYGAMLGGKFLLFAFLLVLGAMNFLTVRAEPAGGPNGLTRVRCFCEAEIGIGLTVLLAAASLTSQPPAADLSSDRLTADEIATRMAPQWPRFATPSIAQYAEGSRAPAGGIALTGPVYAASIDPAVKKERARIRQEQNIAWSEYNHHWAGLVVLAMGLLAVVARTNAFPLARNWPLLFIGLAVFLFFRADAETWPLGHRSFWQSWLSPEDVQHRLFVVLIVAFAIYEWKVQTGRVKRQVPALVFPGVCLLAGAALLAHSHSFGNVKEELYAELSHLPIAILGVLAGWSRWLEIRLPSGDRAKPTLSWIWPVCFVLVGAILLNYREA